MITKSGYIAVGEEYELEIQMPVKRMRLSIYNAIESSDASNTVDKVKCAFAILDGNGNGIHILYLSVIEQVNLEFNDNMMYHSLKFFNIEKALGGSSDGISYLVNYE